MKIKLETSISDTRDGLYAYALRVRASLPEPDSNDSNGSNDPNDSNDSNDPAWDGKVFVFRRSTPTMDPFGPNDRRVDDEFFNVATPVDMYDVPPDAPDIGHGMLYYRTSDAVLWFRNLEDALKVKRTIREDVASLARLWDNLGKPGPSWSGDSEVLG